MRRLLLAATLALAFHSLLFTIRFEGPGAKPILPTKPLTLSLAQAPTDPPASLAASIIPEQQDPLPFRPQVAEEKPQPQKTRKLERPSKRIEPSVLSTQEPAGSSTEGQGSVAKEIPAPQTSQGPSSSTQASLGGGGRELTPIRMHEATPLYRQNPVPEYPLIARRRGYQGTVVLEVLVSSEGKVKELALATSCGYSVLDQAALMSVKTWVFDPGTRGGEKVDMWVKVPVRFRLE